MALIDKSSTRQNSAGYSDVAPAEVTLPPTGFRIIDVREPSEFTSELGHIPSATLVPLATVTAQAATWNKGEEYLLVCRSGGRSGQAAMALSKMGFSKVMNMTGGMLAWNAAGLPIER